MSRIRSLLVSGLVAVSLIITTVKSDRTYSAEVLKTYQVDAHNDESLPPNHDTIECNYPNELACRSPTTDQDPRPYDCYATCQWGEPFSCAEGYFYVDKGEDKGFSNTEFEGVHHYECRKWCRGNGEMGMKEIEYHTCDIELPEEAIAAIIGAVVVCCIGGSIFACVMMCYQNKVGCFSHLANQENGQNSGQNVPGRNSKGPNGELMGANGNDSGVQNNAQYNVQKNPEYDTSGIMYTQNQYGQQQMMMYQQPQMQPQMVYQQPQMITTMQPVGVMQQPMPVMQPMTVIDPIQPVLYGDTVMQQQPYQQVN